MKRAAELVSTALLLTLLFTLTGYASGDLEVVSIQPYLAQQADADRGPSHTRVADASSWGVYVLRRYVDAADYYLSSGAEGDTFVTYFKPLASCSLVFFDHQMFSEGTATAFIWKPDSAWLAAFPNGRAVSRTDQYLSPIGDVLFGPTPVNVYGYGWNTFMAEGELHIWLGTADPYDGPPTGQAEWSDGFLAGWVKGGEVPQPLSDNVSARGFTYTWFGGPWTADTSGVVQWGWYNVIIENMVEIGVVYWPTCPPIIQNITQLPSTIAVSDSFRVTADVIDEDGWTLDEFAYLHYDFVDSIQGTDSAVIVGEDSVLMSQIAVGSQTFEGFLDLADAGLQAGDGVRYWVSCTDNENAYNTTVESKQSFGLLSLSAPNAHILWIDNGQFDLTELNFFERGLIGNDDPAEDAIEVWDADENNGFDASLINARPWELILYTAWGDGGTFFMPYKSPIAGSAFEEFFTTSGNLVFSDKDYAFRNDPGIGLITFGPGEFAYDAFGITSISSDPEDADSLYVGVDPSDPLSAPFVDDPIALYDAKWNDYFTVDESVQVIFQGVHDSRTYGARKTTSGGGAAYYLAFNAGDATYDGESGNGELWTLYTAILNGLTTLPTQGVVDVSPDAPMRWSLSPAWPNPFNPSTRISFSVPEAGRVILEVFDITGRQVTTLQNGVVSAGQHTATFDGKNLASGVYLVRLRGEGFSAARRIVLLK